MLRIFFLVVLAGCFVGCSREKSVGRGGFVYELTRDSEQFFLGGTVHILRDSDRPSDPVYTDLFDRVGRLVTEVDGSDSDEAISAAAQGDGGVANEYLDDGEVSLLEELLTDCGLDPGMGDYLPPHFVVMSVVFANHSLLGASRENGVDARLRALARKRGVKMEALETGVFQAELFGKMPEEMKVRLLKEFIKDSKDIREDGMEFFEAWRAGDETRFTANIFEGIDRMPGMMERLYSSRNLDWVDRIEGILSDGTPTFVAVGAAHLFGEEGLLVLFRERGWSVKRIDRKGLPEAGDGA